MYIHLSNYQRILNDKLNTMCADCELFKYFDMNCTNINHLHDIDTIHMYLSYVLLY